MANSRVDDGNIWNIFIIGRKKDFTSASPFTRIGQNQPLDVERSPNLRRLVRGALVDQLVEPMVPLLDFVDGRIISCCQSTKAAEQAVRPCWFASYPKKVEERPCGFRIEVTVHKWFDIKE